MNRVGLLGYPVAHSLSPAMHRAAFAAAGLDWRYQALEIRPGELEAAIDRLRAPDWRGANVTIPHKQAVLPLLDELSPSAAEVAAVNTVVKRGQQLVGHNTDAAGFLLDLQRQRALPHASPSPQGPSAAMVLGAGGAARAVAFGLAQVGWSLRLIARSQLHAAALGEAVQRRHPIEVELLPWDRASFESACDRCDLIVNATPIGMSPDGRSSPWPAGLPFPPGAFVYDLVYVPSETRLVRQARRAGLEAAAGGGMLLEQGAIAFELWSELRAPRAQMHAALEAALEVSHA